MSGRRAPAGRPRREAAPRQPVPRGGPPAADAPGATFRLRLGDVVAAGGDTLGRMPDGRVVFCDGGLPGETAEVEVIDQRRDYARARVLAVEAPSPDRRTPPCPHARAGCGGCQWQHVDPEAQLRHKVALLADSFRRLAHADLPPGPVPQRLAPDAYRTTVRLAVDGDGRPAYRHRRTHQTLAPGSCLVCHPELEALVTGVRLRPGSGRAEVGLRVGVAGGERLVLPSGGAVVVEAPIDAVVAGPATDAVLHEVAGGRRWRVGGWSFFQSGPAAADLLGAAVDTAVGPLDPGAALVDLYAGVGLLGGVVAARSGARLVAVESSPSAAADATANLADLDAEVVASTVDAWVPQPADVVIADPARPGLGRPGVTTAVATGARRIVLVSCDAASGARDAALLRDAGYRASAAAILDLFPHTFHVEVVTTYDLDRHP